MSDYIAVAELAAEVRGAEPVKNLWEQGGYGCRISEAVHNLGLMVSQISSNCNHNTLFNQKYVKKTISVKNVRD